MLEFSAGLTLPQLLTRPSGIDWMEGFSHTAPQIFPTLDFTFVEFASLSTARPKSHDYRKQCNFLRFRGGNDDDDGALGKTFGSFLPHTHCSVSDVQVHLHFSGARKRLTAECTFIHKHSVATMAKTLRSFFPKSGTRTHTHRNTHHPLHCNRNPRFLSLSLACLPRGFPQTRRVLALFLVFFTFPFCRLVPP